MTTMPVDAIGARLRARRAKLGRTLASVAIDAGLSVPYVANLERGRGNPTLAVLESLAQALGLPLTALLDEDDHDQHATELPALTRFAASERFRRDVHELAVDLGMERNEVRRRVLQTLTAIAGSAPRPLNEHDWHRSLDAIYLIYRPG